MIELIYALAIIPFAIAAIQAVGGAIDDRNQRKRNERFFKEKPAQKKDWRTESFITEREKL
jgi:hypothetical protein